MLNTIKNLKEVLDLSNGLISYPKEVLDLNNGLSFSDPVITVTRFRVKQFIILKNVVA